ncbi:hypothetical protein MTsPCn5_04550 [Croceitalea sp. MTPC5]|uniref:hypothetical protein n=1 Tax=Croceitalea sp. MTPC5 TaxID=3056565 RepID=UPI002B3E70C4|nr:hypothetical protein MTsPCn5_04550 [Croceitalea sp. MTPC5]
MKKPFLLVTIALFIACSSDSSEPQVVSPPDDEVVVEEELEGEEMEEGEESFTFPFSITVVLKDFSNPAVQEGEFLSIDFMQNSTNASSIINLTSLANLDLKAFAFENGQDNILIFAQGTNFEEREFVTYNLNTGEVFSVLRSDLLSPEENCFFTGTHFAANSDSVLFFNYDLCETPDDIIPITRNKAANENQIFPKIEGATMGDSFNLLWATDNHYFFHFNNLNEGNEGQSIDRDGLIVYNARSNEILYDNINGERKIPLVDNQKMIVRRNSNFLDLVDLESGQTLFSNEVSNFEGLIIGDRIGKAYIYENKVGFMIFNFEELEVFPGVYDFQTNSSISFDSDVYREYFRDNGITAPNPFRQPKEHIFDLKSETFAVLYHGFIEGPFLEDNPDFIGLVYMNFDGEILYEYEFERRPWLEQIVVRR